MAKEPKSSENKDKTEASEETAAPEVESDVEEVTDESSEESPAMIEAEATEVNEAPDEDAADSPETNTPEYPVVAKQNEPSGGRGSFFPLVLGGIAAGAIGYAAAVFAPFTGGPDIDGISAEIAANSAALETVSGDLAALRDTPAAEVDTSELEGRIAEAGQGIESLIGELDAIRGRLGELASSLEEQVAGLDGRLLELETAMPEAGSLGTEEQLAALRSRIEEMTSRAEERLLATESEAAQIARAAEEERLAAESEAADALAAAEAREAELTAQVQRQETLIELKAAVEAGASYSDLLTDLDAVPEALTAHAESGVPTIQSLQESFPAAARAALRATVTVPENASVGERLTAFLNRRTNARSLSPQEGDGPDAVLSRAEAHLGSGEIALALNEIETLPEAGQAAMGEWADQARARLAAVAAIEELSVTN